MTSRREFGDTWWGKAWVRALEGRARLDPNRLPRGRTYARQDRVLSLDVAAGEVRAVVQGRQRAPYRIRLQVRMFTEAEWAAVIDAIASRAGHAAALFDGELLPEILDDAESAGVDLLPGPGELVPTCSCPDWADPCKHAAAVCYLVADTLDDDPFELFHLRGRTRDQLLAELRDRRQTAARDDDDELDAAVHTGGVHAAGVTEVVARDVYARDQSPADAIWALDVVAPPERAGRPARLPVQPPDESGLRGEDLYALATDAAARAWALTIGVGDSGLLLTEEEDLARLAARALGTSAFDLLAERAAMQPRRLAALAIAWEAGDRDGVFVTEHEWAPPSDWIDEGRRALAGEHESQVSSIGWKVTVRANRLSGRGIQLRVGPTGLWYRFTKVGQRWQIDGVPSPDPVTLVEEM